MTKLSNGMDSVKTQLDDLFGKMHAEADNHFKENDPNLELDTEQKSEMYEDATAELIKSIATIRKKFGVVDRKVDELGEHTEDLHSSTDKLENLYVKDIEQRKKWIAEHPNVKSTTSQEKDGAVDVNLTEIDQIFDDLEAQENKSTIAIFFSIANLSMVAVILLCVYIYIQLEKLGKNRVD